MKNSHVFVFKQSPENVGLCCECMHKDVYILKNIWNWGKS